MQQKNIGLKKPVEFYCFLKYKNMKKPKTLVIHDKPVALAQVADSNYLNLVHLVNAWDGNEEEASQVVTQWIRTRNTLDYLAAWEMLDGAQENFRSDVYQAHASEASKNGFAMSPQKWVETTGAIGIEVKRGRNGGVFAHEDIAIEFCTWLNPVYKLYVVKQFKLLKEAEEHKLDPEWTVRRVLAATTYRIQTDAVRDYELPRRNLPQHLEGIAYADEAETLNLALFHITSKNWKEENPTRALNGENLRDQATTNELMVLTSLQGINAILMQQNLPRHERIDYLASVARQQLKSLSSINVEKTMGAVRKQAAKRIPAAKPDNAFDANLKGLMAIPPPPKPIKRAKGGEQPPKQDEAK